MAKLSLLFVTLALGAAVVLAQNDQQVIADLVKRGNSIVEKAKADLKTLQSKHSYFVQPLQDEIRKIEVFIRELENLAKNTKIQTSQLGLVEARLLRYENDLLTLLKIEETASKDLTFTALVQMVDQLLARAYADLGKLITEHGHNHRLAGAIREEIIELRKTEDEIKRLNAGHPEEQTIAAVEKLIKHETILENLIFQAEHENLFNP